MIQKTTETIDGREYIHHVSDAGLYIRDDDGHLYSEAYDVTDKQYTESDILLPSEEITLEDAIEALKALGVTI